MSDRSVDTGASQFVERMGVLWENDGLPRTAGRIFGFLLLQPEPCSLDDLAAGLGVSKASVSTDSRRLEQIGFVERSGRPGDRRDYYAIAPEAFTRALALKLRAIERIQQVLATGQEIRGMDSAVRRRLQTFQKVHEHIAESLVELIGRLERSGLVAPNSMSTRT
jgi:DNA-binding transcriptional regulator GbsR (MarR family)